MSRRRYEQTWNAEQVDAFLAAVKQDRLYAAWLVAISTGMRTGEILGLRWQDVDLEANRLCVRQTLIAIGDATSFAEPKTRRQIELGPRAMAALRVHRTAQMAERLTAGPTWSDGGLVFVRTNGSPIHPDHFQRMFRRHVGSVDLPRISLHGLRHTRARLWGRS